MLAILNLNHFVAHYSQLWQFHHRNYVVVKHATVFLKPAETLPQAHLVLGDSIIDLAPHFVLYAYQGHQLAFELPSIFPIPSAKQVTHQNDAVTLDYEAELTRNHRLLVLTYSLSRVSHQNVFVVAPPAQAHQAWSLLSLVGYKHETPFSVDTRYNAILSFVF